MAELALVAAAVAFAGSAYKGAQQKKAKKKEAAAIHAAKNRRMAAATREVQEESRIRENMHSRAVAVAAFSGAGVDNPNVVKLIGDVQAEGMYRMMAKLWQGQNDAEGLIFREEAAKREGDAAFTAGIIDGITSAISVYSGMGGGGGKKDLIESTSTGGTGAVVTRPAGFEKSKWGY